MAEDPGISFKACAVCWNAVSACTCPGKEVVAAEPIAEYMSLVDPTVVPAVPPIPEHPTRCMRCTYCLRLGTRCNDCFRCKNYPDRNEWDELYNRHGRRQRDDPNPLRDGEAPLPPRRTYECPQCGSTRWFANYTVSGHAWEDFDPVEGWLDDFESEYDDKDLESFSCSDCSWETLVLSDEELANELYDRWCDL